MTWWRWHRSYWWNGFFIDWGQCLSVERSPSISSSWMLGWEMGEGLRYTRPLKLNATRERWCHTWLYFIYNDTLMIHNWVRNMRLLFATIIWFQCAWCMEIACDYNPTQEAWHDFGAEPFCLHVGSCWTCHEIPWRPMMIGSFQEINLKHQGDRSDLSPWRTTLPRNLRHVSWQHERLVEGSWRQSIGPPRTWSKHKKGEWKSQCVELFSGEVFFPGKVEAYMSWIYEECTPCPPFSSRCPVSDGGSCSGTCDMPLCLCLPRSHLTPFCEQVCPSF